VARPDETHVDAGAREVRVSSPDRVIFPATEHTPEITKLDVVKYYVAVDDGIMRALRNRPTTLERWPKGVHPGMKIATRERPNDGDAFYQKRVPKGAPAYLETAEIAFPSGRTADEICPTEIAVVAWAAQMGTITFHPWPVRREDVDHPDELRLDLDPQPGTDFDDAVRAAGVARELLGDLGYTGFPKTSGGRGVHIYVRIEPRWTFAEVRRAALALAREVEQRAPSIATSKWWKEERHGVFIDYNQNARDRTVASVYSARPVPNARVSAPLTWDEVPSAELEDFTVATMPARYARLGDVGAGIDGVAYSLEPLLELSARHEAEGQGDAPWPPHYLKQEGEPPRVQPSKRRWSGQQPPPPSDPSAPAGRAGSVSPAMPSSSVRYEDGTVSPTGRRRSSQPLVVVAQAASKDDALAGLERWKERHRTAAGHLAVDDVLVDSMRGRSTVWWRIRVNLRHVPVADRPAAEPPDPDYDPWAEVRA
jgi:DNA ligase D-like protein (predicted polymerase)